eukprot:7213874-Pyramimonas_sp.AAC.1
MPLLSKASSTTPISDHQRSSKVKTVASEKSEPVPSVPKDTKTYSTPSPKASTPTTPVSDHQQSVKIFYATIQGTSKKLAELLSLRLKLAEAKADAEGLKVELVDLSKYDPEDLATETDVAFIVPTYEQGRPPAPAVWFFQWLSEAAVDERVGSAWAKNMRFVVF